MENSIQIDFHLLYKDITEETKKNLALYAVTNIISTFYSDLSLEEYIANKYKWEYHNFYNFTYEVIEKEGIAFNAAKNLLKQLLKGEDPSDYISYYDNEFFDELVYPLTDDILEIILNNYADKPINDIAQEIFNKTLENQKVSLSLYEEIYNLYNTDDLQKYTDYINSIAEDKADYKKLLYKNLATYLENNLDKYNFIKTKIPSNLLTLENSYSTIELGKAKKENKNSIEISYPIDLAGMSIPFACLFYEDKNIFNIIMQRIKTITISEKLDWNIAKNTNFTIKMFTGPTGCGKTYTAINQCINNKKSFVIAVPTRQLACDIKLDYKDKISNIYTGEISLSNTSSADNTVCVYENLNEDIIGMHDVLIVDEAHHIGDEDRGDLLIENILTAIDMEKEIIFLTATDTLSNNLKKSLHIKTEEIKEFKKNKRENIDINKVKDLTKKGKNTIVFVKYMPDEEVLENYCDMFEIDYDKAKLMTADCPTSERLQTQINFKNGKLQMLISTNVLAQGVNLPADIVVIEYNEYDDWELIKQKEGRAGRPQFSDTAYIVKHQIPPKKTKGKKTEKKEEIALFYRGRFIYDMQIPFFQIPTGFSKYSQYKYSRAFLLKLKERGMLKEEEEKALKILEDEENKVNEIINKHS